MSLVNRYRRYSTLSEYEQPTCESCWKEYEKLLFDGVNYVCVDCYERNENINEIHREEDRKG